ncbi:MAG: Polysaccharide deacetylase family protein [Candidatus Woesebacteria bacterium GW2011_GWB1_38_5]|uniref:Polysaccharide deacetylase family protein n=4 Tax=Candidatus Woeseibacteriota TaxID=1752722 RepID=A0A0G0P1L5_9BACT|nr:MAG: Polysaccharide deacetylase family protein [Candidatus Woesebacteria bacterium GW2011_GWD1_38_10]KKQ55327.1 MAG: Polysaccharide deacetylase family protein [Candidatus Woesebacteria bacterium GW2011_GWC1_38_13]KKQ73851.1 MAG: Polysaccharide deacetylase family protein [Candidatus Woesebacteria bacterium GW2011_GWB1_38_5]KKQ76196.1 MAG: Polysaccharide deacetylase family protein [Microgenomates group bacterium GW2011_GWF1_38_5]KKQ83181.1 MAG: Polysaccharide deacetylase family protein [Candid
MTESPVTRRDALKTASVLFSALLTPPIFIDRRPHPPEGFERTVKSEEAELQRLIEKFGAARTIPVFEYHGDNYDMYPGYNMNPDSFNKQMKWFKENEYHAVKGNELLKFLDGEKKLPARSIILTTDSGNTSMESMPRMIPVLKETGMHFLSFIWTKNMDHDETAKCSSNICWDTFRKGVESGVFTFGTHTESHRRFDEISPIDAVEDLKTSVQEIKDNIGVDPLFISWPHESCPAYVDKLEEMGFKGGFGGNSARTIGEGYVEFGDPNKMRWCMPRLLPPNTAGVSGRPNGLKLNEIMEKYCNKLEE